MTCDSHCPARIWLIPSGSRHDNHCRRYADDHHKFKHLNDIAWYGSAYLLAVTAFQPTPGSFYRYFNVKAVYLKSIFTFEGKRTSFLPDRNHLVFSWIYTLCLQSQFAGFHRRSGYSRSGCCRSIPKSLEYYKSYNRTQEATFIFRHCDELLRNQCIRRSRTGWSSHGSCQLEMVLLDVS